MSAADAQNALEALADLRLSLVAAARAAREAENAPLAKELTARAEAVKETLSGLRRQGHAAWTVDARRLQTRLAARATDLKGIAAAPAAATTAARRAARFLGNAARFLRGINGALS